MKYDTLNRGVLAPLILLPFFYSPSSSSFRINEPPGSSIISFLRFNYTRLPLESFFKLVVEKICFPASRAVLPIFWFPVRNRHELFLFWNNFLYHGVYSSRYVIERSRCRKSFESVTKLIFVWNISILLTRTPTPLSPPIPDIEYFLLSRRPLRVKLLSCKSFLLLSLSLSLLTFRDTRRWRGRGKKAT